MNQPHTRLYIQPSADVLHQLIGDEGVLDLRRAVLQQFADKYFKRLGETPELGAFRAAMEYAGKQAINEYMTEISGMYGGRYVLKDTHRAAVKAAVKEAMEEEIRLAVQALKTEIEPMIQQHLATLNNEIGARLARAVDKAIKDGVAEQYVGRLNGAIKGALT